MSLHWLQQFIAHAADDRLEFASLGAAVLLTAVYAVAGVLIFRRVVIRARVRPPLISPEQTLATARLGFVEYLASTPWRIHLLAEWPLAIAQCLFYTLLGRIVAGEPGGEFAFIGALALVLTLSTVGGVGSLPGIEKWGGTFFRLQLSGLPPASVFGLRSLPYVANGVFSVVLCLVLVAHRRRGRARAGQEPMCR